MAKLEVFEYGKELKLMGEHPNASITYGHKDPRGKNEGVSVRWRASGSER